MLDLSSHGIATVGRDAGAHFDFAGTGFAQATGWIGAQTGLLVLPDANGQVTQGRQLFGDEVVLPTDAIAVNGFEALAALDSNRDGVIDARDAAYGQLRVWADTNTNGKSDAGELKTLSELGIQSIHLAYARENAIDAAGNLHLQASTMTMADGSTRAIEDVWFAADSSRTVDTAPVAESAAIAALPDLAGTGTVHSLHQAMARDASGALQALVQQFLAAPDRATRLGLFDALLDRWAGVDPHLVSRTPYLDDRKLFVLEAFLGVPDRGASSGAPAAFNAMYANLTHVVYGELLAQIPAVANLQQALHVVWDTTAQTVRIDAADAAALIRAQYAANPAAAATTLADWADYLAVAGPFGQQAMAALRAQGSVSSGPGLALDLAVFGLNPAASSGFQLASTLGANGAVVDSSANNTVVVGVSGSKSLTAGSGNDVLLAGRTTTLTGGVGTDVFLVQRGSGATTIVDSKNGGNNQDTIVLGAGMTPAGTHGTRDVQNNLVLDLGGGEQVTVNGYFASATNRPDILFADGTRWNYASLTRNLVFQDTGSGHTLTGLPDVDNVIIGGTHDRIVAGNQNDTITAGVNNTITAGSGIDTVHVNRGSGQTTFIDSIGKPHGRPIQDIVQLGAGITVADTHINRSFDNALVLDFGGGDTLAIPEYFDNGYWPDRTHRPLVTFTDGTRWDKSAILNQLVFRDPTAGGITLAALSDVNNTIVGGARDTIVCGNCNDTVTVELNNTVVAGIGIDTVIVPAGSGTTTYAPSYFGKATSANQDTVQLGAGITATVAHITRDLANNLLVDFGHNDTLKVTGYFNGWNSQPTLVFADGTHWDVAAIANHLVFQDTSAGGNSLAGLVGMNNVIVGAASDAISCAGIHDTVTVGKNNTVFAGAGVDTILVNAGSGVTTIAPPSVPKSAPGNQDVVTLGTGIAAATTQITRGLDNSLTLNLSNGDSVRIADYFKGWAFYRPGIIFADGTRWNYATVAGQLVFRDTSAGGKTLIGLDDANNTIVGAANDTIDAGKLNDTITVGKNNTVVAGRGVDTILVSASTGQTTISYSAAGKAAGVNQDGVQLGAGIASTATHLTRDQDNNLIVDCGQGDSVTITGYFNTAMNQPAFSFADGTRWDYAAVTQQLVFRDTTAGRQTLMGLMGVNNNIIGAANDTICAGNRNDTVTVGRNNTFWTGAGVDTVIVQAGSGTTTWGYNRSYGNAKTAGVTQDVVQFGAGMAAAAVHVTRDPASNDLWLDLGGGDQMDVKGYFNTPANRPQFQFADCTVWNYAAVTGHLVLADTTAGGRTLTGLPDANNTIIGAANDTLVAGNGNDILTAGPNNLLRGGTGIDTFIVPAGSGKVVIDDSIIKSAGANQDVVTLGSGIHSVTAIVRDQANNLVLRVDSGDQLTINGYFATSACRPALALADGSVLNSQTVIRTAVLQDTGSGATVLRAPLGQNNIVVGAAGDVVIGGDGNDVLAGGPSSGTVAAGNGNALLIGGPGTHMLGTGRGTDVIAFNRGDGQDLVYASTGKNHVLSLGHGIRYADLALQKQGSDLTLQTGSGEQIVLKNWYTQAHPVTTLQICIDTSADYQPASADALHAQRVQQFDFGGLVARFDQAVAANPALGPWALANALTATRIAGSDTGALGGDLAYQVAAHGSLSGVAVADGQAILADAAFGSTNQVIRVGLPLFQAAPWIL